MREAGGIPFVKTNVSQNLANYECSNPLWGVTKNPYNTKYIPGGSTGGEGALLAMGGSAIGWGSDIGGSIRVPAHFCGLYGFKPGSGRISLSGTVGGLLGRVSPKSRNMFTPCVDPIPGFKNIPTVLGPMTRSVEDIELVSRVVFGGVADYCSVPVPYREVKPEQKLKFGYYFNDGMALITPACRRAVSEAVKALRKQGHDCVEFELPSCVSVTCLQCVSQSSLFVTAEKASEVYIALTSAFGNKNFFKNKGPDPTV